MTLNSESVYEGDHEEGGKVAEVKHLLTVQVA